MPSTKGHKLQSTHDPTKVVKHGSFVTLHYVGKLADGTIFETTNKKPLRIAVGEHAVIRGLEEGILGMHIGDKKRIIVPAEKAYGKYHKDLEQELELNKIPPEVNPAVGVVFTQQSRSGRTIYTRITKLKKETVIIDLNHPFAGKTLVFDVVVMDIQ